MIRPLRKIAVSSVAALSVAVGVLAAAGPAIAATAPPGSFEVDYDVSGSSLIKKPNATVKLGPTVGQTFISDSGDGTFTGRLPLPPTQATFKAFGLLPVSATVNFIPVSLNGKLSDTSPIRLTATARYTLRLTNVKAFGLPTFQGNSCQTTTPVSIPVATPRGQEFDLTTGGNLTGTYTIGNFANCGLTTFLINQLVPGPNNTASLQLSNGRFIE